MSFKFHQKPTCGPSYGVLKTMLRKGITVVVVDTTVEKGSSFHLNIMFIREDASPSQATAASSCCAYYSWRSVPHMIITTHPLSLISRQLNLSPVKVSRTNYIMVPFPVRCLMIFRLSLKHNVNSVL